MLLSELVARLMEDIPAVDGVPSDLQYEQAVKDAVRDFSERCGVEQIATLSIASGTATYDLPADFLALIALQTFAGQEVIYSADGLIPVPAGWCERYTIRNGQITFYPTPRYTLAREFRYKAAWILTEAVDEYDNSEYETLGEREARIVLLKAQAIASTKKANAMAGDVMKYSLGAVSVDKSTDIESLTKKTYALHGEYVSACDDYNGRVILAGGL